MLGSFLGLYILNGEQRGKKERVKSISLKAKKESSDDETSTSGSDDEEYDMAVRNFKKFFRRKDAAIQIISLAIVQNHLATKIKRPSLEVLGAIAKMTPKTKPMMKLVSWLNLQMSANSLREMLNNQKSSSCKIGLGFDDSKASTRETKNMSFVGSSAEKATDGSTIKVCLRTCLEPDEWIKDSGCSKHMTGNKSLFSTYIAYDGAMEVQGIENKAKNGDFRLRFEDVYAFSEIKTKLEKFPEHVTGKSTGI
ncbi:hypothetical protein Tco_1368333 [Tanacetum coccineum]